MVQHSAPCSGSKETVEQGVACFAINIISHRSPLVDEAGCEILVTDLVQESQLDLTTDQDIWSTVARLKASHTTMFLAYTRTLFFCVYFLFLKIDSSLVVGPINF